MSKQISSRPMFLPAYKPVKHKKKKKLKMKIYISEENIEFWLRSDQARNI